MEQEKPRSMWPTIAFFCMLFALLAGVAAVAMWMTRGDDRTQVAALERDTNVLKARLSTAEREKATLERQLNTVEAASLVSTASEEEQILSVAKQYSASFMNDSENAVVVIEKKEENQALVSVQKNNVGCNIYLKKTDETWVPIWAGKGGPNTEQRSFYGIKIE